MSNKLMVFGGSGFVGGNLTNVARAGGWEVIIADSHPGADAGRREVNITDRAAVMAVIEEARPNAVVNVAAIADIDQAEQKRELAHQVNVDGARSIALACARYAIPYIFFSSDAVFDGERSVYSEEDAPHPTNYYGQTKAEAEQAVLAAYPDAVVVRVSLVLGYPVESGNSFFANLEGKLKEGKAIPTPTYEIRTPIDVITLSECVLELCQNGFAGRIHLGAVESISRYALSRKLARKMGYDEELILPQEQAESKPGRAPRHRNGIISVAKAQGVLRTPLLSVEDTIRRAFVERPARRESI